MENILKYRAYEIEENVLIISLVLGTYLSDH